MVMPKSYLNAPKEYSKILSILFRLADHITQYKMSQKCRDRAEKERQMVENLRAKENQKEKQEVINSHYLILHDK